MIVLLAFAPLGHAMAPRVTEDRVIAAVARRTGHTPAQVALAWAVQRGTAFLTTWTDVDHIRENIALSPLAEDAMEEMRDGIATSVRFNAVTETGVPGFCRAWRELTVSERPSSYPSRSTPNRVR